MKYIRKWLDGFAKSKTMTFATILAVLGAVQMYVDILRPWFGSQQAFGYFCMVLAAIVAVLRVFTYQSIVDKGFPNPFGNGAATNGTIPPSG